ncbi:hypothetical protein QIS74_13388 [Colletotrichum tabaci]|uniref:Uncharacterized protein n=1 Tax=Colletotrichum tabaci TaxID=1209068 RepID=A0AAV9STR0_9PEZI
MIEFSLKLSSHCILGNEVVEGLKRKKLLVVALALQSIEEFFLEFNTSPWMLGLQVIMLPQLIMLPQRVKHFLPQFRERATLISRWRCRVAS